MWHIVERTLRAAATRMFLGFAPENLDKIVVTEQTDDAFSDMYISVLFLGFMEDSNTTNTHIQHDFLHFWRPINW